MIVKWMRLEIKILLVLQTQTNQRWLRHVYLYFALSKFMILKSIIYLNRLKWSNINVFVFFYKSCKHILSRSKRRNIQSYSTLPLIVTGQTRRWAILLKENGYKSLNVKERERFLLCCKETRILHVIQKVEKQNPVLLDAFVRSLWNTFGDSSGVNPLKMINFSFKNPTKQKIFPIK